MVNGMKLTKKGLSEGFLVTLVIVLISFFAISAVVFKFFSADTQDKGAEQACKNSVGLRASTAQSIVLGGGSLVKGNFRTPLLCKTLDVNIKGKKEEALKTIADKMARCWWQFGEGRLEEVLTGTNLKLTIFGDKEKNKCFLCYSVLIKDLKDNKIDITELSDYLRTHKYSKVGKTYLEYIQSYGGPGRIALLTNEIKENGAYGIVFISKNVKKNERGFFEKFAISGITAGVFTVACAALTGGLCGLGVLVLSTAAIFGAQTYNELQFSQFQQAFAKQFYEGDNQDTSVIVFDELNTAQKHCFKGDLGGQ